jgi:hypothetical protein
LPQTPLNGWKEIAAYLGRSIRSVQRDEREHRLPVRRIKTADGQTVYAHRHEIDAWRLTDDARQQASSDGQELAAAPVLTESAADAEQPAVSAAVAAESSTARRRRRREWRLSTQGRVGVGLAVVIAGAAVAAFVLGGPQSTRQGAVPTSTRLAGRTLEALDDAQRVLWTHAFNHEVSGVLEPSSRIVDIDADGQPEVVVVVRSAKKGQTPTDSDAIYVFAASTGKPKWTFVPTQVFGCGETMFGAPWFVSDITISTGPGPSRIWVAFHHAVGWPNFVVELKTGSVASLRYVQAGSIISLAHWTTQSGSYLVAGGVMGERARGSLTLVDDAGPAVTSPHDDRRFTCTGTPSAAPAMVWLFPPLDIEAASTEAYSVVGPIDPVGPNLRVTFGIGRHSTGVITELAADLHLKGFTPTDSYWLWHQTFEHEGKLNHSREACPERLPQEFQQWTVATGWRKVMVSPDR